MLSRAALRASRAPSSLPRYNTPTAPSLIRTYASKKRSPPSPIAPQSGSTPRPAASQPVNPTKAGAPQARQTSPGTSYPKDQTWKPQDSIKFGGPAASTPSDAAKKSGAANLAGAAATAASTSAAQTPIEGARPQDSTARAEHTLESDVNPQEPMAQKADVDEPVIGSLRSKAQEAQAASENIDTAEQPDTAQKPLPDLRQGIPSTFEMEFGQAKAEETKAESQQGEGQGQLDMASSSGGQGRQEREERDYDRSAYETSLDRRRAQMANWLYASILTAAVGAGLWLGRPINDHEEVPSALQLEDAAGWSPGKMYARIQARFSSQLGYYTEPTFPKLLPEVPENQRMPLTLVLSLEDLLVHTSWDRTNGYRVAKRPGVDYFIRYLSQYYEIVLFTSAPKMMADPVMMKLDPYHFIIWQLGREATKYEGGEYVKDLSYLNRNLAKTLIIDTKAGHVKNQPENAIILDKWSGDAKDPHTKDLVGLIPFLEYIAVMPGIDDIRPVLKSFEGKDIPQEFARREGEARKRFLADLEKEKSTRPKRSLGSLGSALGIKSGGMGGNMVLSDGSSVSEGFSKGKMLSDQFREAGQKQYEHIEKQIREHGEQWLKEEQEEMKKLMEASTKETKQSGLGMLPSWLGGGGGSKPEGA